MSDIPSACSSRLNSSPLIMPPMRRTTLLCRFRLWISVQFHSVASFLSNRGVTVRGGLRKKEGRDRERMARGKRTKRGRGRIDIIVLVVRRRLSRSSYKCIGVPSQSILLTRTKCSSDPVVTQVVTNQCPDYEFQYFVLYLDFDAVFIEHPYCARASFVPYSDGFLLNAARISTWFLY